MSDLFHHFTRPVGAGELPERFTWPFCYVPHPLCIEAADAVRRAIARDPRLEADAGEGKMFGVLVVEHCDGSGTVGYLAAFSGLLGGRNDIAGFVPPIFDTLDPAGYFKQEEARITAINHQIATLKSDGTTERLRTEISRLQQDATACLAAAKSDMAAAKAARDLRRKGPMTDAEAMRLLDESRHERAEYRRLKARLDGQTAAVRQQLEAHDAHIGRLRRERRERSAALQRWLFGQCVVDNALGEHKDLNEVFRDKGIDMPPSGAGDCAAPKLLAYAYRHGLRPRAMAEFWIGRSPRSELRRDGLFYPSCSGKCGPILTFMLRGLDVEHDPVAALAAQPHTPSVIYDDDVMAVIDKPTGMLAVPGRLTAQSAVDWVRSHLTQAGEAVAVHRLDMDTSGLMVIAKSRATLDPLRRQFEARTVVKRYTAIVDGTVSPATGRIDLPLSADYHDRPRQKVDMTGGARAVTDYAVIGHDRGTTRVIFTPLTGRTHQLRVHSASILGLNAPIVGDRLYGTGGDRLCLHASHLELRHPVSGEWITFDSPAPF